MEIFKLNQWVVWKYDGEQKVPVRLRSGKKASVTDPSHWSPFEEVEEVWNDYWGIGFVFTMDDPYCGIDLDDCIDLDTGEVEAWAQEVVDTLRSYTEISPSETGLKIWVKAVKPGPRCKQGNFEMYDSGHYFTFTGRQYSGYSTIESRQDEVEELYRKYFPERTSVEAGSNTGEGFKGDDDELYQKMRTKGADSWAFRKLYEEGEWDSWGNHESQSEADYRLCCILAYWIGPDEDRIVDWFMSSPLADNLDRKADTDDYLERTIIAAIGSRHYSYNPEFNSATTTVRDALTDRRMFVLDYPWTGRSGPTDRDVYRALLSYAWKYGKEQAGGITIAVSDRDLTLQAGLGSSNTTRKAIDRLVERHSLVSVLSSGGKRRASTYLLTEIDPNLHHKRTVPFYGALSGQDIPLTMKVRNASRNYGTIGKRSGEMIDLINAASERVSLDKLAQKLKVRKNHLKARNIKPLLEEGFIVGDEQGYGLPDDIEDRLRIFLEESGSNEAERRVKQRIDRDREGYNHQKERKNVQGTYNYQNEYDPAIHDALDAMDVFHAIECTYSLTCDCPKCYMDTMVIEAEEMEVAA